MNYCVAIPRRTSVVACLFLTTLLVHPLHLSGNESQAELAFFEQHVRPLLIEHCYECHAAEEQSGGLRLDSRPAWQAGGDSGPILVAGDPERSLLIEAVRYTNLDLQMPPAGKLSSAEIAALEKWVSLGAPDPRQQPADTEGNAAQGAASGKPVGMSIAEGQKFWSLRPLAQVDLPAVEDRNWPITAVDTFILSQLAAEGLSPAPPADKRTLIRRATFDLTGLPATPSEIESFVADSSPTAYSKLIERLLASPQYGERWGRHWLDVARYADSNGLDENLAFGNAWRYRDYVIRAFNQDKPFDRFLTEQIAGDLLPGADDETLTATGFLMLGAKVLAEPDREKLIMDTVDEQIDTTGKAFLGMTFGCARCHDHKFDPILQADYYALAGFFKSTMTFDGTNMGAIKHWHEYGLASEDELQQLKPIDADIAAKKKAASDFKAQAMSAIRQAARANAAQYLAAASLCDPLSGLNAVQDIAQRYNLHPRILHHLCRQLELRRDDPVVQNWQTLVATGTAVEDIERYYSDLLSVLAAAAAREKDKSNKPIQAGQAETVAANEDGEADKIAAQLAAAQQLEKLLPQLLVVPVQPEFAFDADTLAEYYALMEVARVAESHAPDPTSVMGVRDGKVLVSVPIHIRGSHRNLGKPVPRAFPAVMRTSQAAPVFPRRESGRLELARWMASSQHPLTARVYVNRIWRWHFGQGLVGTTENFGVLGDRPSHPELLDWLARYFIEAGWSTKELHRLLMTSRVYQMSAVHPREAEAAAVDPENKLLWKFRRQRLEAEQLRDAVLALSGRLDMQMGGKSVPLRNRQFVFDHTSRDYTRYDSHRRAVYLPVIRNNIYTLFEQFDFPDATMPTGSRQSTVVAPQALLMLNDDLIMDAATGLAARICGDYSQAVQRADWSYRLVLGRPGDPQEVQRAVEFVADLLPRLADQETGQGDGAPDSDRSILDPHMPKSDVCVDELQAWAIFCQALLASNEFITVE